MEVKVLASSSKANCSYVSDGETSLLIDAGLKLQDLRKRLGFRVSEIAAALITHSHHDHSRGVAELARAGVDCYMSQSTADEIGQNGHRIRIIRPLEQFSIGTWTVVPFDNVHDVDCLGFLLAGPSGGKILYLTDTPYCKYRFDGLTVLMVECNHSAEILRQNVKNGEINLVHKNRVLTNHMGLERLLDLLKANDLSRVQEIHLLHLSDQNSDAAAFKKAVAAATGKPVYVAPA